MLISVEHFQTTWVGYVAEPVLNYDYTNTLDEMLMSVSLPRWIEYQIESFKARFGHDFLSLSVSMWYV